MPDSSWLEFLEKISVNNSALSDAEDNTFEPLNRGDIADLTLLKTLLAVPKVLRVKFLGRGGLFY